MTPLPSSYTVSIHYDRRLYRQDIAGSVAHARMLEKQGIISYKEMERIVMGLTAIRREIQDGSFPWREDLEDIHMNVESRLHEKIGPVAGKLHTARSRNDQIATDVRLFTKEAVEATIQRLRALQHVLLDQAETNLDVIVPGYTHLQRAQPVLLAHHLLAYFQMLQRDGRRFQEVYNAADVLPLGSGALAGVPYRIDREFVARELGFSRTSENSLDAVSDRDFLLDYEYAASTCMMHLSRLAEETVLWSSEEFGFLRLSDEYTTGSSIMPQKRNPDFAEVARGKTGRVYGHLMGLLTTLKALPLAYNRDMQEDKEGFFDTLDTLHASLDAFTGMLGTAQFNPQRMREAVLESQALATDLADYLVERGMPFREAHGIVAQLVVYAWEQGRSLGQLPLEEYHRFSPVFDQDVYEISVERSLAARDVPGGTAPRQVALALDEARRAVEERLIP